MWLSVRARLTGNSHQAALLSCQDCAEQSIFSDGCMVCVVADGASDAILGEIGASIAVESVKKFFEITPFNELRYMDKATLAGKIRENFFKYLNIKMAVIGFPTIPNNYAATVAFTAIYEPYDRFFCGVVGDCAVAAVHNDWSIDSFPYNAKPKMRPDFITDSNINMKIYSGRLSEYRGFAVTTDGCAKGGLVGLNNRFDDDIVKIIFDNLTVTQNPEMWLGMFMQKNISKITGDDLSMYVLYNCNLSIRSESAPNNAVPSSENMFVKDRDAKAKKRITKRETTPKAKKDFYNTARQIAPMVGLLILALIMIILIIF